MSVDRAQAEAVIQEFVAEHKALENVKFRILIEKADYSCYRDPDLAMVHWAKTLGAFLAHRMEIHVAPANHRTGDDLRTTLAHEGIGHFGINTLTREDKRGFLDAIIDGFGKPGQLGEVYWPWVERAYNGSSIYAKAEEIYCRVVERTWARRDLNLAAYESAWSNSVIGNREPLALWGIAQIGQNIAQGLRENTRHIQIIPKDGFSSFRPVNQKPKQDMSTAEGDVETPYAAGKGMLPNLPPPPVVAEPKGRVR